MLKPRHRSDAAPLVLVNFKADPATLAALDKLTAATATDLGALTNGGRSQVIRRALQEAAARLVGRK
jgi:hypothetical protein